MDTDEKDRRGWIEIVAERQGWQTSSGYMTLAIAVVVYQKQLYSWMLVVAKSQ